MSRQSTPGPARLFAGHFLFCLFCLISAFAIVWFLTGNSPFAGQVVSSGTSVSIVGLPEPEIDLAEAAETRDRERIPDGLWSGSVRRVHSGQVIDDPIAFRFSTVNGERRVETLGAKLDSAEITDVREEPGKIEFTYRGRVLLVDTDYGGHTRSVEIFELYLNGGILKGHQRRVLHEAAGEIFTSSHDVRLSLVSGDE